MSGFDPRSVTLDPATWTPVTPPADYDHVSVTNQGAGVLRMRPLSGVANEVTIAAGVTQSIAAPANHAQSLFRFPATAVAFYLKPDSGTGPALLVWA